MVTSVHDRPSRRAGPSRRAIIYRPRRRRYAPGASGELRDASVEPARLLEATEAYGVPAREHRRKLTSAVAVLIHALVLVGLVSVPALLPPELLPQHEPMVAFLAKPLTPPPPPPPPPPAPPLRVRAAALMKQLTVKLPTPASEPAVIPDEAGQLDAGAGVGSPGGVPGGAEVGVPGGVQGGVPGGVVGGLPNSPAPAPAPPPDPVRLAPNASGAIPIVKVDPVYPEMALKERVQGVVILDVVVDREGMPLSFRVVRSHAVFDASALEAVKQWRWSPYLVENQPVPFKVLVTVQFTLATKR